MTIRSFTMTKDILRFEGSDKAAYWRKFSMLLTLAVVIATMGLIRNSSAVIIAAMLVAPLMTPILGIASSIIMGWVGRAVRLMVIVWAAAGMSVLIAWFLVWIADVPLGILIPSEVISRSDPGSEDLVIALAAGVAGAYVQIRKSEISLLPGAAIGVSLVPPLAAAGILLYYGEVWRAYEAAFLFATNFGAIILSACIVYLTLGPRQKVLQSDRRRVGFTLGFALTFAFLGAIIAHLSTATYYRYNETKLEAALAKRINSWAGPVPVEVLRVDVKMLSKRGEVWLLVDLPFEAQYSISSTADLVPARLKDTPFRDIASEVLGPDYVVTLRYQTRISWNVGGGEAIHELPPSSITSGSGG